jgi:hypothetical protein
MPETGLTHPEGKEGHPRGGHTEVQSILLPKESFPTEESAEAWLEEHEYRTDVEDSSRYGFGGKFWRARQFDPQPGTRHRVIPFGASGIEAVIEATGPEPESSSSSSTSTSADNPGYHTPKQAKRRFENVVAHASPERKTELWNAYNRALWMGKSKKSRSRKPGPDNVKPAIEYALRRMTPEERALYHEERGSTRKSTSSSPRRAKGSAEKFYDEHPKTVFGTTMVVSAIAGVKLNERVGHTVTPLELQPSTATGIGLLAVSIAARQFGYPRTSQVALAAGIGQGLATVNAHMPEGGLMAAKKGPVV